MTNKKQKLCDIARGLFQDYARQYYSDMGDMDDYQLLKVRSRIEHDRWKTMKALRMLGCTFKTKEKHALDYEYEGNLIDEFLKRKGVETEQLEFERDKMKDKRRSEERRRRY
jgi:hypothetical protein